jgi:hypothetical protein
MSHLCSRFPFLGGTPYSTSAPTQPTFSHAHQPLPPQTFIQSTGEWLGPRGARHPVLVWTRMRPCQHNTLFRATQHLFPARFALTQKTGSFHLTNAHTPLAPLWPCMLGARIRIEHPGIGPSQEPPAWFCFPLGLKGSLHMEVLDLHQRGFAAFCRRSTTFTAATNASVNGILHAHMCVLCVRAPQTCTCTYMCVPTTPSRHASHPLAPLACACTNSACLPMPLPDLVVSPPIAL